PRRTGRCIHESVLMATELRSELWICSQNPLPHESCPSPSPSASHDSAHSSPKDHGSTTHGHLMVAPEETKQKAQMPYPKVRAAYILWQCDGKHQLSHRVNPDAI